MDFRPFNWLGVTDSRFLPSRRKFLETFLRTSQTPAIGGYEVAPENTEPKMAAF